MIRECDDRILEVWVSNVGLHPVIRSSILALLHERDWLRQRLKAEIGVDEYERRKAHYRLQEGVGGEHSKHPTGDYCVYCRAQWPCEDSLRGGGE